MSRAVFWSEYRWERRAGYGPLTAFLRAARYCWNVR